jgi:hypothetical protein
MTDMPLKQIGTGKWRIDVSNERDSGTHTRTVLRDTEDEALALHAEIQRISALSLSDRHEVRRGCTITVDSGKLFSAYNTGKGKGQQGAPVPMTGELEKCLAALTR